MYTLHRGRLLLRGTLPESLASFQDMKLSPSRLVADCAGRLDPPRCEIASEGWGANGLLSSGSVGLGLGGEVEADFGGERFAEAASDGAERSVADGTTFERPCVQDADAR